MVTYSQGGCASRCVDEQCVQFQASPEKGIIRRMEIPVASIPRELGWKPSETFESGIEKTVRWYLDHQEWVEHVTSGAYRDWVDRNYEGRAV